MCKKGDPQNIDIKHRVQGDLSRRYLKEGDGGRFLLMGLLEPCLGDIHRVISMRTTGSI